MTLPPPPYARQGGEVIVAQLAKIGIMVKIAERRMGAVAVAAPTATSNYDLTIISHVEPFDLGNYAKPDYYWGYESPEFTDALRQDQDDAAPRPSAPSCWATRSACSPTTRPTASCTSRSGSPSPTRASRACGRTCRSSSTTCRRCPGAERGAQEPRMKAPLHALGAVELVAGYRSGTLSPVEVTQAVLAHIERWEPHLHALWPAAARGARWSRRAPAKRAGCAAQPLGPARRRAGHDQGEHRHPRRPDAARHGGDRAGAGGGRRAAGGARCAKPAP